MLRRLTELAGFAAAAKEKAAKKIEEENGSGAEDASTGEQKSTSVNAAEKKKKKKRKKKKEDDEKKKKPFNFQNAIKARRKVRDRVRPGLKDIRRLDSFRCKCGHVIDFDMAGVKDMLKKAEELRCSKCDRKLHRDFEGISLKSNAMGGSAYDISFPDDCDRFEVPGTKWVMRNGMEREREREREMEGQRER